MRKLLFIGAIILAHLNLNAQNRKKVYLIDSLISCFNSSNTSIVKARSKGLVDSITMIVCKYNLDLVKIDQINYGNVYTHFIYFYYKKHLIKVEELYSQQSKNIDRYYFSNNKLIYKISEMNYHSSDFIPMANYLLKRIKY